MTGQSHSLIAIVILLCLGFVLCEVQPDRIDEPQKRGGARPFFGFSSGPGAKRLSDVQPYYLYEKRGGGRSFHSSWSRIPYGGPRLERRGGGRAFSGGWGQDYSRFYDTPYFNKRSSNLWEFLQGNNDFYNNLRFLSIVVVVSALFGAMLSE